MYLIQTFLGIICLHHTVGLEGLKISPGVPVPHADELDRILSASLFENTTEFDQNSVFDYLFGVGHNYTDDRTAEHLDISVLDPDTINKIVLVARRKHAMVDKYYNVSDEEKNALRGGWHHNKYYVSRTMNFMQQSIYTTRARMEATRPLRRKYQNDISYNIGILYGTLMQLRIKLDNVYASLNKVKYRHSFIWFLFLYQKCLALNTDITFAVERIYDFQSKFNEMLLPKEERNYYIEQPGQQYLPSVPNLPPTISPGGQPGIGPGPRPDAGAGPGPGSGPGPGPGSGPGPGPGSEPGSNPGMGPGPGMRPGREADLNVMADLSPMAEFGPGEIPNPREASAVSVGLNSKTDGLVTPP